MAMTLKITDGSTTINLVYHSSSNPGYDVAETWAPATAPLRHSDLGGSGPYEDVIEDIPIRVFGATAADAYSKVDAIMILLDQADRWWRKRQNVAPVVLQYSPHGAGVSSSGSPLKATILGRVQSDSSGQLTLPARFNRLLGAFVIDGIRLRFVRRGALVASSDSASAAAAPNPAVLSVAMPASPVLPGALQLDFTGFTSAAVSGNIEIPSGYVMVGPNNSISLLEGENPTSSSLIGSMTFAATIDTTARASNGNVGRLNGSIASFGVESSLRWTLPAAFATASRIGVFLTYRNNSASAWKIRASAYTAVPNAGTVATRDTLIDAALTNPTVLFLGEISGKVGFNTLQLTVSLVSRSGAATLDIDTVVVVDLSSNQFFALAIQANQFALGGTYASLNFTATVNFSPATLRDAEVKVTTPSPFLTIPTAYTGDAAIVGSGSPLQALWYCTHLYAGTTPYWTTQNITGAATLNIGATITRRQLYLTPQ